MSTNPSISELKQTYVRYFTDVPIQKYAAMAVGRDEDTIMRWRKEDHTFADAVQKAKAEWVRKKMLAVKAEFALERLEKEIFSQRSEVLAEVAQTPTAGTGTTTNLSKAFRDFVFEKTKAAEPSNL